MISPVHRHIGYGIISGKLIHDVFDLYIDYRERDQTNSYGSGDADDPYFLLQRLLINHINIYI
jgi:hypothetical protein